MPWVQPHTCAHWHVFVRTLTNQCAPMNSHAHPQPHTSALAHPCTCASSPSPAHASLCKPALTDLFHPTSRTSCHPLYPLAPEHHHASRQGGCAAWLLPVQVLGKRSSPAGCTHGTCSGPQSWGLTLSPKYSSKQEGAGRQVCASSSQQRAWHPSWLEGSCTSRSCGTRIRNKQVRSGVNQAHGSPALCRVAVGDWR